MTARFETRLYPALFAGAPGLILAEVPAPARGPGLLCGRFTFVVVETDEELQAAQSTLSAGGLSIAGANVAVQRWNARLSQHQGEGILVMLHDRPEPGWPYVLLIAWPADTARQMLADDPMACARGRYTVEAFETLPGAAD